ncbi:exo-beta-N-acetylmuramidase NamZ domain-containing protein [Aquimarina sp. AU474]|uniref:exo-beta-N-acetylmuramidase NamZ family protein n=1 Tax=Aquimarina sp. AU474 TaxID=2108529 RepID=UPI000D68F5B2|nr:DUF1343 domain-containing protein [Aquimarina sp. AU474]
MIFIRNAFKNTFLFLSLIFISCISGIKTTSGASLDIKKPISEQYIVQDTTKTKVDVITGANQTLVYIPMLENKNVAIVGNQTTVIFKDNVTKQNYVHLVDSLLSKNIKIQKVFAPEHGFRGKADAGELVANGKDIKTGLPIFSLYGKDKKPSKEELAGIDIVVFDIQDVGVRFYTYISTLHYVMQACAENNIPMLILDRPNPNAHYIDGPTMEPEHTSFLGIHPIPLVHGMTIGEYAKMVNGEGWLGDDLKCEITIVPIKNYTHNTFYSLPIRPSPNLPNDIAINLYPSLGFFEGTTINAGRGTETQFQIYGSPDLSIDKYDFAYIPKPNFGAKYPKHRGEVCYGNNLEKTKRLSAINLWWLVNAYKNSNNKEKFFNTKSFTSHAGTKKLQQQIEEGVSVTEIKKSWSNDLKAYKEKRKKYLIYK